MNIHNELISRNQEFAADFRGDVQMLPNLRLVLLTCLDPRVDPAHILGLNLGDAVVIRNTGGRVTKSVVDEIATLSVMVNRATGGQEAGFHIVLMQHTQCGAQQLAHPQLRSMLAEKLGVDTSEYAITDHQSDLQTDIKRLVDAHFLPDAISVSALLYDVATGQVGEIVQPKRLSELRTSPKNAADSAFQHKT